MPNALDQVIEIHQEMLNENSYCYFELAYTRTTEWMVWVCSNSREIDPNRKVLLCGQGDTPEEASLDALVNYRKEQCLKNEVNQGSSGVDSCISFVCRSKCFCASICVCFSPSCSGCSKL